MAFFDYLIGSLQCPQLHPRFTFAIVRLTADPTLYAALSPTVFNEGGSIHIQSRMDGKSLDILSIADTPVNTVPDSVIYLKSLASAPDGRYSTSDSLIFLFTNLI
jgi:hypothetical protein